ncbi:hypothetical protein FOL47_004272 [Perkinsus chesapeaki]|uniref:Rab-GAP TBC domain-containing protein n=1 Tax=Perkinsus chesapeaki TaxID=330153 RepID=A0A7J6M3H4_PERCH|nr:hypothetical protein FOL47_004272 [Perkinsus chesapeaki]
MTIDGSSLQPAVPSSSRIAAESAARAEHENAIREKKPADVLFVGAALSVTVVAVLASALRRMEPVGVTGDESVGMQPSDKCPSTSNSCAPGNVGNTDVGDSLDLLARVIMESNRFLLGSRRSYTEQRQIDFDKILKILATLRGDSKGNINMNDLRNECLRTDLGLGGPSLRSTVWKILLGYLPERSTEWDLTLEEERRNYFDENSGFVHDTVIARREVIEKARKILARKDTLTDGDRELAEVVSLLDQINKDVYRTRPESAMLDDDRMKAMAQVSRTYRLGDGTMVIDIVNPVTSFDRMGRVLFVYATLNPGLGYVQGMHELLAVMYLLFCQDPLLGGDQSSRATELAEADAFYCLTNLMSQHHRDVFLKQLDRSDTGIAGTLQRFDAVLWVVDREVYVHMAEEQVSVDNFAFRWFTLLLSQEFEYLPDVWRLWDCILTDLYRRQARVSNPRKAGHVAIINYICAAMIELVRPVLLAGDFSVILRTLQNYPPFEVEQIIQLALQLRDKYNDAVVNVDLSSNRFMHERFHTDTSGGGSHSDPESPSRGLGRGYRSLAVSPPQQSPAISDEEPSDRIRPLKNVMNSLRGFARQRKPPAL